jgi:hypothetical protein
MRWAGQVERMRKKIQYIEGIWWENLKRRDVMEA